MVAKSRGLRGSFFSKAPDKSLVRGYFFAELTDM
jgi:hypothetical protein